MSSDAEWDLLTTLVTAANRGDQAALCSLLASPETDLSDKPRCIHAAMLGISITPQNVKEHSQELEAFLAKITKDVESGLDVTTSIRLGVLRQVLHPDDNSRPE
jgi:hypothetical protein